MHVPTQYSVCGVTHRLKHLCVWSLKGEEGGEKLSPSLWCTASAFQRVISWPPYNFSKLHHHCLHEVAYYADRDIDAQAFCDISWYNIPMSLIWGVVCLIEDLRHSEVVNSCGNSRPGLTRASCGGLLNATVHDRAIPCLQVIEPCCLNKFSIKLQDFNAQDCLAWTQWQQA